MDGVSPLSFRRWRFVFGVSLVWRFAFGDAGCVVWSSLAGQAPTRDRQAGDKSERNLLDIVLFSCAVSYQVDTSARHPLLILRNRNAGSQAGVLILI